MGFLSRLAKKLAVYYSDLRTLLLTVSSLDVLFIWIAYRAIYTDSAAHTSIK